MTSHALFCVLQQLFIMDSLLWSPGNRKVASTRGVWKEGVLLTPHALFCVLQQMFIMETLLWCPGSRKEASPRGV